MNDTITFKYLIKLLFQRKDKFIYGQLLTIFAICASIPIPLVLPKMVDEVVLNKPATFVETINFLFGSGNAFYYIAIVTLLVMFLRFTNFLLTAILTKIFTTISRHVTFEVRKKLLLHLQNVNMNEYESLGNGAVTSNLVTDINTLDSFLLTSASKFISAILTLIIVGVVLLFIHPLLGIMILVIEPLVMFISKKISRNVKTLKKEENEAIEVFQNKLGETLELFSQIKASNKEKYFFDNAIQKANEIQIRSNNYSYKSVIYERFSFTIFLLTYEILRASAMLLVIYSDLSLGLMIAMFGYIWFIITPIQEILSMQYSYASASAAIKRLNKILALKTEYNSTTLLPNDDGITIALKNLTFKYNEEKEILKQISLTIYPKQKVALIGSSGSGKTTLAQIISGFYEKDSGELLFNNINIEDLNRQSLRENIFLVLQMPLLFNDTLRFNITMGKDSISDEEILKAIEIAQLLEDFNSMPQGLDTIVGKHGIRLSGGQRQRLSIARMIIANPKVIIFDESTSALDVHCETKLFNALKPILENKTVITIAHRLSTVKNSDIVYVLESGKIVQSGTHESLEIEDGHYNDFIKHQLV